VDRPPTTPSAPSAPAECSRPLRIAYLAPHAPFPLDNGAAIRVESLREALSRAGTLQLSVLGDLPSRASRAWLRAQGARLFPSRRERHPWQRAARIALAALRGAPIPSARYLSPRRASRIAAHLARFRPDVVVLGEVYQAPLIPALRPLGARIVVDTHDAASRVHRRIAAASRSPVEKAAYALLARNTARAERRLLPLADQLWTISEEDAAFYRGEVGLPDVQVVPNALHSTALASPGPEAPGEVAFVGSFSYWPNEDAALRLIELTRPLAARGVVSRVCLVGLAPTARMRAAAVAAPHVLVTGAVESVVPWLERAQVVVIPLAAGSGIKMKVLEAMALGRPVLTTPLGAEGLAIEAGREAEVVPLAGFAAALEALLASPARRASLAAAGRRWVGDRFSSAAVAATVRGILARGGGA
jgi:glycosyltransferase involved in cell wall biosynthesis